MVYIFYASCVRSGVRANCSLNGPWAVNRPSICKEHVLLCKEHFLLCKEHVLLCKEHVLLCKEHVLLCKEHFLLCKEHFLLCVNQGLSLSLYLSVLWWQRAAPVCIFLWCHDSVRHQFNCAEDKQDSWRLRLCWTGQWQNNVQMRRTALGVVW